MDQRERGYIVQQVTEVLLTKGASIVRKYTQGWKVFRLRKGQMRTIAQGKCAFMVGATELAAEGKRLYRLKAYFVPGPLCGLEWQEVREGLSWCFGHVLPPAQGQPILCRVLRVSWDRLQLPTFEGTAFATKARGERSSSAVLEKEPETKMMATLGGTPKAEARPAEPQGAELCFAAGLGRKNAPRQERHRGPRFSLVKDEEEEPADDQAVLGSLRGRKLTAATKARGWGATAGCSRCLAQVPLMDALVCCYRRKEVPFPSGPPGGKCGTVFCVGCFNGFIDEEGYPNWQDEAQSLLTPAHVRTICNFVCPPCRYSICCDRMVPVRDDSQYRYSMELITQYMVDMYNHLARSTAASYGQ
jgi:hypothetical protein